MRGIKISQSITNREDASLNMYFRDVSKQKMITAEEEAELAERIKNGDQRAKDKLVTANLRFAISVAKQYQGKGLPLVDLIQYANEGLIKSVSIWDPTRGIKFISYAVWWIRQSILQALTNQSRTVRIPMSQVVALNKINKVIEKFGQEYGRDPSIDEIAEETNISESKIDFTLNSNSKSISLETSINKDEGCLLDVLPDENSKEADESLLRDSIITEIDIVLKKLSPRESDILRMHFGLGVPPMTNEEIAMRFGIGSERVRQIQHEAIEKIKIKYSSKLKEFL